MSRARHKRHHGHSAGGGETHPSGTKVVAYNAAESNVMKEARARKHGGRVHHGEGEEAKHHAGKRARGGAIARKEGGSVIARKAGGAAERKEGGSVIARKAGGAAELNTGGGVERKDGGAVPRARGGRVAGRARGGATGSDHRPLSSAAHIKFMPEEHGGHGGAGPANEQTDH